MNMYLVGFLVEDVVKSEGPWIFKADGYLFGRCWGYFDYRLTVTIPLSIHHRADLCKWMMASIHRHSITLVESLDVFEWWECVRDAASRQDKLWCLLLSGYRQAYPKSNLNGTFVGLAGFHCDSKAQRGVPLWSRNWVIAWEDVKDEWQPLRRVRKDIAGACQRCHAWQIRR